VSAGNGTPRPILSVNNIEVIYDHVILVLRGVSLRVPEGGIVALLGANGAGKSTIIKAIMGVVKARGGSIEFAGRPILGLAPHRINQAGIAWVPEGRQLWSALTVLDNLRMGAYAQRDRVAAQARIEQMLDRFPILRQRQNQLAGSLSGGEQQMCAIARALVTGPKLLLMDEPSLGLAPLVVRDVFNLAKEINGTGVSILMVEQNARQALSIADRGYVLVQGRNRHTGTGEALLADPEVRRTFLGG
jgi:branched-chain amino acid transport system ATP-binding protein